MARPRQVVRSKAPRYSVRSSPRRRKRPGPPLPPVGPVTQIVTAAACLILSLVGALFLSGLAGAVKLPAVAGYVIGLTLMGWVCMATNPARLSRIVLAAGLVLALVAGVIGLTQ